MTKIIDGKELAKQKEKKLVREVAEFKKETGISSKLTAVMIGDNPASKLYLQVKEKAAKRVGILFEKKKFSASAKPSAIVDFIKAANDDLSVHGIMVQLPLPKQSTISPEPEQVRFRASNQQLAILGSIDPKKDSDCLTPENLGLLMMGNPRFLPATVRAVMEIIKSSRFKVQSSNVVIAGAGQVAGLPLAVHLKNLGATVTVCDGYTQNLTEHTKGAEILISATGIPGLVKKDMVKKGAVVIDVGSPKGDVDFEEVKKVASAITPVPGGVGPLTVISLLENVFLAAKASL